MAKTNNNNKNTNTADYSYYSKVLGRPFDSVEDLLSAEAEHAAKLKAKEDAATQKKNDAAKVELAFKDLNLARREFKEKLAQLTAEYAESLENLKKAFELGQKDLKNQLANAETAFDTVLKEFNSKYENYHMTLKDGDFETTISSETETDVRETSNDAAAVAELFRLLFGI